MAYKVKFFDIHTPHFSLLMHEKDCADLGLRKADRVKVMSKDCSAVAIMDSTETMVQPRSRCSRLTSASFALCKRN